MTYGAEGFLLRSLDGYGTVGTGLGAGTGAGTVYRYGTGTVRVRYGGTVGTAHGYAKGTVCVPMYRTHVYRTDRTRTMHANRGRNPYHVPKTAEIAQICLTGPMSAEPCHASCPKDLVQEFPKGQWSMKEHSWMRKLWLGDGVLPVEDPPQ